MRQRNVRQSGGIQALVGAYQAAQAVGVLVNLRNNGGVLLQKFICGVVTEILSLILFSFDVEVGGFIECVIGLFRRVKNRLLIIYFMVYLYHGF